MCTVHWHAPGLELEPLAETACSRLRPDGHWPAQRHCTGVSYVVPRARQPQWRGFLGGKPETCQCLLAWAVGGGSRADSSGSESYCSTTTSTTTDTLPILLLVLLCSAHWH